MLSHVSPLVDHDSMSHHIQQTSRVCHDNNCFDVALAPHPVWLQHSAVTQEYSCTQAYLIQSLLSQFGCCPLLLVHFYLSPPPNTTREPNSTWEWQPSARIRGFAHPLIFAGAFKALAFAVRLPASRCEDCCTVLLQPLSSLFCDTH